MCPYSGPRTDIVVDLKRAAIEPFLHEHPAASYDEIVSEVIRLMKGYPSLSPRGPGFWIRDESGEAYLLEIWVARIRDDIAE